MKNFSTLLLFSLGILIYLSLLGNRGGAPTGRTGAPGESTCATSNCHDGTVNSGSATIELGLMNDLTAYTLGATHTVSISIDGAQSAARNGFEIVALDAQNANVGEWILSGDDKRTRSAGGKDYVTQTRDGSGQSSWEIDWKAPESDAGDVTFYLAYNDANDNGGSSGDNIYTTTLTVAAEVASSINTISSLEKISIYPNPVKTQINLKIHLSKATLLTATLRNTLGQSVGQLFHEKIPVGATYKAVPVPTNLMSGHYFLELKSAEGGIQTISMLKE